jgi:trichodiene synthase
MFLLCLSNFPISKKYDAHILQTAYFAQPLQQETLKSISSTRMASTIRTITQFIAYTYSKVPRDIQIHCSIYWCLITILDDEINNDPNSKMGSFCQNLIQGKEQQHPFWILMKEHLPRLLDHYGNFSSFNTFRATIDYFEGCWIEQHNFHGYPNSKSDYPFMLRRFGSLGGAVGGTLFPGREFDDQKLFKEFSSLMAQMDGPVAFVNDLLSFFKEFNNEEYDNVGEEVNFVSCIHTAHGLTLEQALERVSGLAIDSCVKLFAVFEDKDPKFRATIHAFIHGYITWHFVDLRYRLREVYENVNSGRFAEDSVKEKFCKYYEKAFKTGWVDLDLWALPERRGKILRL